MEPIKKPLSVAWKKAKIRMKEKQLEEAVDIFDMMLVYLAKATLNGITYLEGAPIDLWKARCWEGIEMAGALPPYRES
jgi:hypothetical protein